MARAEFLVAGHAAPKGSRKYFKNGGSAEMSKRCGPWVERVAIAAAMTGLTTLDPPYAVTLSFSMPEPKKPTYGWPVSDGDLDKLVRAVLDGLQPGEHKGREYAGLLVDDKHVTRIVTEKVYGTPCLKVVID